jgi:protein phosphatase
VCEKKALVGEVKMERNFIFDDLRVNPSYDIAFRSGIGMRDAQQDAAYIASSDEDVLAVVCDGMGGIDGGQLASKTAVEAFVEYYQAYVRQDASGSTWMQRAAEEIDDIVYSLSDTDGHRIGAGTTLLATVIHAGQINWLSVGDSRIYILRGDEMVQVACDHNYFLTLNQQRQDEQISPEKYREEALNGEALISFIGMGGLLMMDRNEVPLQLIRGDVILLCTDGLYRTVSPQEIQTIVKESSSVKEATEYLDKLIQHRATPFQDNYTFVIIKKISGDQYE